MNTETHEQATNYMHILWKIQAPHIGIDDETINSTHVFLQHTLSYKYTVKILLTTNQIPRQMCNYLV